MEAGEENKLWGLDRRAEFGGVDVLGKTGQPEGLSLRHYGLLLGEEGGLDCGGREFVAPEIFWVVF